MAEHNIDPGGGGGSDKPQDKSLRDGEPRSDQGDVGAQPSQIGDFSVPEVSVKREEGKDEVPKECKTDSPTSHQSSTQQSETKQQPQPVTQVPAVPTSRTITKVNVHVKGPEMTPTGKEANDVVMTQEGAQPSRGPNKRTEKKKRNRQNRKLKKELEDRQHEGDESNTSVAGDNSLPSGDNGMKDDDSRHNTEEGSSHNAAASFEPHDQGEQTSKSDPVPSETPGVLRPDNNLGDAQGSPKLPLEPSGEVNTQYDASLSKTADPLHPHDHGNTQDSKLTLEASGEVNTQYDASLSKTADPLHPHDHGNTQDSKLTLEASGEGNTQPGHKPKETAGPLQPENSPCVMQREEEEKKAIEKKATALSDSSVVGLAEEKVFGKGKDRAQRVPAAVAQETAMQKTVVATPSVKNGDKGPTRNDLATNESKLSDATNVVHSSAEQIQSGQGDESINQGSTERKPCGIKVILHAFIDPAHWGKTRQDLTVEVRSSLDWTKSGAEVHINRLVDGSILAVDSTLTLPQNMKFPFQYKYYVRVSTKPKDCYEHLSIPANCNYVNRCIRSTNGLVQGMQANTFHQYDDFVVPSPKSTLWTRFKSSLGFGSDPNERNIQLLNCGIQHHLDSLSDLLIKFISGTGRADQLIERIVLVCKHVNDHCVVSEPQKELSVCGQADVQKMVVQWILKLAKTMTETSQLSHDPVQVAELQVMGLVAITIIEAVLPENMHSNLSGDELEEVAQLLCYRSIPVSKIQECQAAVCKYFSTMRRDTIQSALQKFMELLASRMKITMILDGLLLLTSWCDISDLDQCNLDRKRSFVHALKSAFSTVPAKMHAEFPNEWLAISMSSFEYLKYKRFSHFVLKIIPLQYWVAVAMYTPLQILIQGLDEQLGLRKIDNTDALLALLNSIINILQDPSSMLDKMNSAPGAISALVKHSWHITDHIITGSYFLDVKTSAFHFYLNVCGVVTATGDHTCLSKFPYLANCVERVVQTLLQHFGGEYRLNGKFGSGNPNLFGHELGVWVGLLTPRYPESVESSWHQACGQKLSERLSKLTFELQLQVLGFCKSRKAPEALVKILLDTAVNAFAKCSISQQEKHLQGEHDWRIQEVFTEFTDRQYKCPNTITLHDLCTWTLWPCYFKLASTCERLTDSPAFLVASELLQTTAMTIDEGTITVEEVRVITTEAHIQQNLEQMLGFQSRDKECIAQTVKKLQIAKSRLATFEKERSQLISLLRKWRRHIEPMNQREWHEIQELCQKNVESLPVAQLQDLLWSPPASKELKNIISVFAALFDNERTSGILQKLWDAVCPPLVSRLSVLAEDVWQTFIAELRRVSTDFMTLNITCAVATKLLHSKMANYELNLLEQALRNSGLFSLLAFSPDKVRDKLLLFENMMEVRVGAKDLVKLKNIIGLTGDFHAVESIARCAEVFSQEPLHSLDPDDSLRKVVNFLMILCCGNHFSSLRSCLCGIRESSELVKWLRTDVQDVGQLQNFTNIALISHCEDGPTAALIKGLETVGTKLAPFIYHLKPTAGIIELIDCCKKFRMDLDDLEGVAELLDTCQKNLEVYKSIQRMLSSVENTTFSQIQDVTNNGEYTVMVPKGRIPSNISDLIKVVIQGSGRSQAVKSTYSLDDLKDLQSKLALIRGNISDAKIQHMATAFWQGLEVTVRLADTLLKLLLVGHVQYSSFRKRYARLVEPNVLERLESDAKVLEADLEEWNAQVKSLRTQYYELNYFTSRQLSLVCQQLSESTDTKSLTQTWFCNLLLSIYPAVKTPLVLQAARAVAADRERTDQQTMLGLRAYNSKQTDLADVAPVHSDTTSGNDCMQCLTVDDLDETEKEIFDYLTSIQEYLEPIVLRGLAEFGPDSDAVERYCQQSGVLEVALSAKGDAEHPLEGTVEQSSPAEAYTEHPLVARMVDQDFPVDLIMEAIEIYGDDEDEVFSYCESEEKNYAARQQGVNVSPSHGPWPSSCVPVRSMLPVCIQASSAGFWELKEVGQFLELVSRYHQEKDIQSQLLASKRAFSSVFETGSPNLVLVPRADLYRVLLSVYQESEELPLPTMEEVLLCHSGTSAEDICLLWRRAMCDPEHKRIFCLVCEHNLSYKIAKEAVQSLRELSQGHKDFRIVIVCCREDEGSSLLVSDLRDYKRSSYPQREKAEIREYLRKHFIEDAGIACQNVGCVGASVDPDTSCVRIVTSTRSGMGKSLYIHRLVNNLEEDCSVGGGIHRIVTLHGPDVSIDMVVKALSAMGDDASLPTVLHLDVSERVIDDIGSVLFSVLILRGVQDSEGNVWRCNLKNLSVVEVTIPEPNKETERVSNSLDLLLLLPTAKCLTPLECLDSSPVTDMELPLVLPVGMDLAQLCSEPYQRVFQYLSRYRQGQSVDAFSYSSDFLECDALKWIKVILSFFKLQNPSWREVCHFVQFLNVQLEACEQSVYCKKDLVEDHNMGVVGFKTFVVKFMIRMSVDFTVPSLKFETGSGYARQIDEQPDDQDQDLEGYQIDLSRAWDTTYHPYIFFNRDWTFKDEVEYDSMTFVGFNLQQVGKTVQLLDLQHQIIEPNIMSDGLYRWLRENNVDTRQDPDEWSKKDILRCLCRVMENSVMQDMLDFDMIDPDCSYALTYDNLLKMLAIQMRFRCNIPVVIIGETGCGKTRLVRYMCQLQARLKMNPQRRGGALPQTFFILKVHGGITENDIITFIKKVQEVANKNRKRSLETVVFFDEANTTDALGLIKEIMCDRRMRGEQIHNDIKFIAACNPYRKHSDDMIERLESAGLGFFICITETKQKLGDTPLRHLVYRVLDLPSSMRTLVYDYGSLGTGAESVYIRRIVENHVNVPTQDSAPVQYGLSDAITRILSWCQEHMRQRKDECSYVSLRDIERFMIVYKWFLGIHEELSNAKWNEHAPDAYTMAMILSLTVCYSSRLIDQNQFEEEVVTKFVHPFELPDGVITFRRTVFSCQEAFLSNMVLGPNIARNAALRENVFMMAVCVELRIPLFVVGKPGSSKSLAKSIVAESMKGQNSITDFLKKFKSVKLLTYQCSQLSTPESIIHVFKSAQNLQSTSSLSLVVLDEVGLAEDSPSFPLKALHPLLEDGTDGSGMEDKIMPQQDRVAFIGISNWALDPAKMNRGIMVMRGEPSIDELVNSARGICSNLEDDPVRKVLEPLLDELAESYLAIVSEQAGNRKEFFGLRDFYSLIKMLYWLIRNSGKPYQLTEEQLQHSILRNFGGTKQIDPLQLFAACVNNRNVVKSGQRMDCSPLGLIQASLSSEDISWHGENRYLLFLTENDAALEIMQNYLFQGDVKPYVLFGSSFPRDKDYTQVCRNINQIKICMETGRTVVLLNLENLYESLYDLLNQYYTKFLGSRYVDLGLQSHRIKCRVDEKFKLILIADMDKVYEKFPIPLINRLEKHIVTTSIILQPEQRRILSQLLDWLSSFCTVPSRSFKDGDAFIGYQSETAAAVVLHASRTVPREHDDLLKTCKKLLIQMACPDALARLKETALKQDAEKIWEMYFSDQEHLCLSRLIRRQLQSPLVTKDAMGLLIQVTTHSLPLSPTHVKLLCSELKIDRQRLLHLYIEEMDTEADFTDRIRKHMSTVTEGDTYILVQCSSGHLNKDLISCARHKAIDELENFRGKEEWKEEYVAKGRQVHVMFIVSLPKTPGGTTFAAFQGGRWLCVHLDDLRSPEATALTFMAAVKFPLSKLFSGLGGIALYKRLQGCLQAAIAQIPEVQTQDRSHKTEVLKIMHKALGDGKDVSSGENTFYSHLVLKITPLLQELEQSQTDVLGKGWAVTEALDPHKLQEGGTFLNTLLRRIDGILTDLLAYIIEFIDQHNNLALFHDDQLQGLWLDMFHDDRICAFSYKSLHQSAEESKTKSLVQKLGSVSVGKYSCKMPFSWIVVQAVEAQWSHSNLESDCDACQCLKSLYGKIEVQHIGAFFRDYPVESAPSLQLHLLYLKDFVASVLQSHSVEEAEVLETILMYISDQMLQSTDEVTLLHRLVSYHVAYHLNEVHFAQYRVLGSIFPDLHGLVVDQLAHQLQGTAPAASSTFIAEPLDLLAVRLLLERIAPKPLSKEAKVEFWNIKNLRNVYIKKLRECQTTVDGILQYSPCNSVQTSLRVQWHSVRAVQMYIEHLILPLSSNEKMNEEITKGAFRLWSALTRPGKAATFSRKEQLERFIDILRSVDDRVAAHFGFSSPEDRQDAVQMGTVTSSSEASYGDFCRAVKMLFLEVVSVLCFGQGSYESPTPELIELLMKQVFQNQATQDLTPLAWEESDSSPVIRSVLLQLILMGSEMEVDLSRLIESFISTCSRYLPVESQPKLLYSLVIRCLEDTAYKAQFMGQDRKDIACSLEKLGNLLESSIQSYARHDPEAPPTFKWLNDIAQLRIALALSADYLCMYVAETPEKRTLKQRSQMMLEQFVALLSACLQRPQLQDLSLYLAKQIARRHGMIMLKRLNQEYSFVLPLSLQQHQMQHRVPDLLVLSGDGYSEVREAIMQAIVDESDQSFRDTLSHLPAACALCIPLAVFAKLTWPTQSILKTPDEKLLEDISSSIQQCGSLDHSLTELSLNLLRREVGRGFTQMQPSQDMHARMLTTLVLHVVTAVFSKQRDPLLKPFVSILTAPATMAGKYLPTMPEDFLVQAMTLMDMAGQYRQHAHMRGRFYSCPNGHPYIITECTGPNQSWNCPECHQRIGAHNSQLAQGNRTTPMASRTEVGYILGDTRNRSQEAIPERNLSPLACAVMRFILHACFMWSACHQPEAVSQSIIAVAVGDVATFFWEHLRMDMRVLGRAMSSAEDEVALYLHQIIASISSRQDVTSIDGSLASKTIRNNWEDHFCRQILDPWLQNPAAVIQNGLDVISKDAELDHDEVFLAVYEKTGREPNMMQTLWAFRTRITLQDLTSNLNNVPDVKHKYPLLHKFLQEDPLLRALQYLPSIVQLQRVLVACFNHKIDRSEAQALTIRKCFNQVTNSEEERVSLVECLAGFRKAWELVKERLAHHRIRIPAPDVQTMGDVSEDLPVAYVLPCVSGPGLCSLALADFLLFQQNELIEHCAQSLSRYSCFSRKSIPLSQVQPFHMVSYEGEIDSVILTHCRYSLIFGKGQEVEYDFAALEKHIYDRFLVTKPEIDGSSQPLMMYTSDIIRQDIFQQLRDKIKPQIVLSPEEKWEVLDRLHNNLRHITEALSIVTTAMGFLASAGSCPDMPCAMKDYILKVLKIRKTEFCSNCTLQHILSLWETLALEKARMHSLNGKEIPFDGYNDATRELFRSMPEEAEKAYKRSLKGIPLDSLMSLLFQFVQVRLRTFQPQEFQWPLKDCLQSYSPDCYDSNILDLEERLNDFPEDVLVEHAVHVWHITVRHHHDLLQNSSSVRY